MKKFFAAFCGLAVLLALVIFGIGSSASAADTDNDGINNQFETTNWWDAADPDVSATASGTKGVFEWAYRTYPIACNKDSSNRAIDFVWTTDGNEPSLVDTAPTKVENTIRRSISILASAAKTRVTDRASLITSRAPRVVTVPGSGNGDVCKARITKMVVPEAESNGDASVLAYLKDNLDFTGRNRIYAVFVQDGQRFTGGGATGGSLQESEFPPGVSTTNYTSPNYYKNYGAFSVAYVPNASFLDKQDAVNPAAVMAHELTHAIGGIDASAPHYNPENRAHPNDCNDILCYQTTDGGRGQSFLPECGGYDMIFQNKFVYRLDCNSDDYYNTGSPAWESTRWNSARSAFLWGNPQPTVAAP